MISYYQQLRIWKESECEECAFTSACTKSVKNLGLCFNEDGAGGDDLGALIKRTLRVMCNKQRKHRRANPPTQGDRYKPYGFTPPRREATLICSNKEEFSACLQSV